MKSLIKKSATVGILSMTALMVQSAYAQSSVTVYGIVDAGVQFINAQEKGTTTKMTSGNHSGSRLGFKGTEQLSNDLSAIFVIENGFDVSSGNEEQGRLFGRQAYLGLSSKSAGTVTLGRQNTLMMDWISKTQPFGNSDFSAKRLDGGLSERADDLIKYTNKFAGVSVGAEYSRNYNASASDRADLYSLGLRYNQDNIDASLIYYVKKAGTTGATAGNKETRVAAGLAYGLGDATLFGGYRTLKQNLANASHKNEMYWAGASYKVSPTTKLMGAYHVLDGMACSSFTVAQCATAPAKDVQVSMLIAGLEKDLSKRTKFYTNVAYVTNKKETNYGVLGAGKATQGENQFGLNIGLRHAF